ncbi:MAG: rod shape-determining protein MreC [Mailhella sp.]|nr:rod shape-determining protein MreC [Mailhella sp.]
MVPRRIFLLVICTLLLFLGIYTWNQRTGQLDRLCAGAGLEFAGGVMRGAESVRHSLRGLWQEYVDLRMVREENDRLRIQLRTLRKDLDDTREDMAELKRLRRLMHLAYRPAWPAIASRVLALRMGPNAALNTLMLSNGYLTGAAPGTPVVSWQGVAGRVLKSGPTTSVALLLTDTGSRVSVITSEGRVQGIVAGGGPGMPLELRFVRQNSVVHVGEVLLTSGLDSLFPKGIPVARVTSISSGASSRAGASVLSIQAEPLVDFNMLEEVFLLQRPDDSISPEKGDVYTRRTPVSADQEMAEPYGNAGQKQRVGP